MGFFIAAAAGIILSGMRSHVCRSFAGLLFAMSLGTALGSVSTVLINDMGRTFPYTGIPIEHVDGYSAWVSKDSEIGDDGRTRISLELSAVHGRHGAKAQARGEVFCLYGGKGTFRWGEILNVSGILKKGEGVAFISFPQEGSVRRNGWESPVFAWRARMKTNLERGIDRVGGSTAGLLKALLLGVREDLSPSRFEAFRKSGSIHILALSGMHLGILSTLIAFVFGKIVGKRKAFFISAVLISLYVFIVGLQPSLMRSYVMFLIFGAGMLIHRQPDALHVLFITFMVFVAADVASAYSLSFILSFLALGGILTFGKRMERLLNPWVPKALRFPLSASVGAQIATTPVLAVEFGILFPIGLFASILIAALVTVFMWAGLVALAFSVLPFDFPLNLLRPVLSGLEHAVNSVAEVASLAPSISIDSADLWKSFLIVGFSALCIGFLPYLKERFKAVR